MTEKQLSLSVWIAIKPGEDRKFSTTAPPSDGWRKACARDGYTIFRGEFVLPPEFNDLTYGEVILRKDCFEALPIKETCASTWRDASESARCALRPGHDGCHSDPYEGREWGAFRRVGVKR